MSCHFLYNKDQSFDFFVKCLTKQQQIYNSYTFTVRTTASVKTPTKQNLKSRHWRFFLLFNKEIIMNTNSGSKFL